MDIHSTYTFKHIYKDVDEKVETEAEPEANRKHNSCREASDMVAYLILVNDKENDMFKCCCMVLDLSSWCGN